MLSSVQPVTVGVEMVSRERQLDMRKGLQRVAVFGAGLLLAGPVAVATAPTTAWAAPASPGQFVAKLYSEALGRIPDAGGWTGQLNAFASAGCTATTVRDQVRAMYNSAEFLSRPYDAAARVLAIYRGALNREPDQGGLDAYTGQLQSGALTWPQVVDSIVSSSEFANLVPLVCSASTTSYYVGAQAAPTLPVSGSGFAGGTGQQLQALLNATPAGGTVTLAQKAVVRISAPLVIPAGVTLTTNGAPGPTAYALQGRLVRAAAFDSALVQVSGGGRLNAVWVDGQRGSYVNYVLNAIDVQTLGGSGTAVTNAKLSNSLGWSTLQALGTFEGRPCAGTTVSGNLVTAYSSDHLTLGDRPSWTDGLSIACENALIEGNSIIDATDVGIVLFRANPANQRSTVRGNQILNAGNSAYGAISIDGLHGQGITPGFAGATVLNNVFWTAPRTHADIGLAVGTRPWFGNASDAGTGVSVTDNTTNGLTAVVGTGMAVSGMFNATVQRNSLQVSPAAINGCPHVNFGIDANGYAAGGNFQAGATSVSFGNGSGGGCIGHAEHH